MASAWDVAVYNQRIQRARQLAPVKDAMLRPDFPHKQKNGWWLRDEIVAWGMSHIQLSKDRRNFKIVDSPKSGPGIPQSPAAENFQHEFGFEEKLVRFAPDYQKRLLGLYDKWLYPNSQLAKALTAAEKTELERSGLIATASPEAAGDAITGGMRGVANHIRNNFPGVVCTHTDIHHWSHGEYLPMGCTENFPGANERGAYLKSKVHPWVERYLKKHDAGQNLPMKEDPRQELEILELQRKREEFRVWQQEHSDKYLLKETARRTGTAIGSVAVNVTREAIEKLLPKRFLSNISQFLPDDAQRIKLAEKLRADCIITFTEWQSQFTGRLAELMQRAEAADK